MELSTTFVSQVLTLVLLNLFTFFFSLEEFLDGEVRIRLSTYSSDVGMYFVITSSLARDISCKWSGRVVDTNSQASSKVRYHVQL